jgi:hypothetical protein
VRGDGCPELKGPKTRSEDRREIRNAHEHEDTTVSVTLVPKLLFGNALLETLFRDAFETGVSTSDVSKQEFGNEENEEANTAAGKKSHVVDSLSFAGMPATDGPAAQLSAR